MRNLGRQFASKVRNRNVRTLPGTAEKPQGRFFNADPYQSALPAFSMMQNKHREVAKSMGPPRPESGVSVYKSWHRSHEPYVVRQKTLFNPGQFGSPELDDRDLRTRQQLFKTRWGE